MEGPYHLREVFVLNFKIPLEIRVLGGLPQEQPNREFVEREKLDLWAVLRHERTPFRAVHDSEAGNGTREQQVGILPQKLTRRWT